MFLCSILVFVHIFSFQALGAVSPMANLESKSAILMEASTGKVLYENNADEVLPPASVTKVMTMLLIFEAQSEGKFQWDDMVRVSAHAASMGGSQVYLEEGEEQRAEDMVKCIAVASANDASVAMAEFIGGSEEGFVDMMNSKAKELGMKNTTFKNACGLDEDGHVTTARDIAIMSRELITKYPDVKNYSSIWMDEITHKTKKGESVFGLSNTNKLIKWYDGATGLKTGSTSGAKYCLSGTAERNGMELISVVMAAPEPKKRFEEVMKMFDWGFGNYTVESVIEKGTEIGTIDVINGMADEVLIETERGINILTEKGGGEITKDVIIYESLKAPFEKGKKAGEIIYYTDGKEVARTDIVAAEGCQKADIFKVLSNVIEIWAK